MRAGLADKGIIRFNCWKLNQGKFKIKIRHKNVRARIVVP